MKNVNAGIGKLLAIILVLTTALSACGGTDEQSTASNVEKRISVGKPLPMIQTNIFPDPGSASQAVGSLTAAGANVLNQRCGSFANPDRNNVGGTPNYGLVLELGESQLPLAIAGGFVRITESDLLSFDGFDCASRGL